MKSNRDFLIEMIDQYTTSLLQRARFILPNSEDAEDMVQDVFIVAFEGIENYKGNSNIKTWLMGILSHKVADYYRKKYKATGNISLDTFFDESGSWKSDSILKTWEETDESLLNDGQFRKTLEHCLNKLPEKWSIPVKMYYLEEKKSELISQELNITTTNLWKILQRSRLQLRECLDTKWFNQ